MNSYRGRNLPWRSAAQKIAKLFYYFKKSRRVVVAAFIEKDGKILIAKRKRGDTLGGKWEFPGGKRERGETDEACLKREILEELALEIEVGPLFSRSAFRFLGVQIELAVFRARYVRGILALSEHDDARWVSREELPGYDFVEADMPVVEKILRG